MTHYLELRPNSEGLVLSHNCFRRRNNLVVRGDICDVKGNSTIIKQKASFIIFGEVQGNSNLAIEEKTKNTRISEEILIYAISTLNP